LRFGTAAKTVDVIKVHDMTGIRLCGWTEVRVRTRPLEAAMLCSSRLSGRHGRVDHETGLQTIEKLPSTPVKVKYNESYKSVAELTPYHSQIRKLIYPSHGFIIFFNRLVRLAFSRAAATRSLSASCLFTSSAWLCVPSLIFTSTR